jgi:hypothetical protein
MQLAIIRALQEQLYPYNCIQMDLHYYEKFPANSNSHPTMLNMLRTGNLNGTNTEWPKMIETIQRKNNSRLG